MEKRPILIITAMKNELEILVNKLENLKISKFNNYDFYIGIINNYPVIICHTGISTINSAVATFYSIQNYKPIAIIVQGTSGSHSLDLHINDIVIGTQCINIQSIKTPHKQKNDGSNNFEWEYINFIEKSEDKLIHYYADKSLLEIAKQTPNLTSNKHFGILASGDIWNNEYDRICFFNTKFNTLCEDMESISVYKIANEFNIPVIGIRVISNNELTLEKFNINSTIQCQEFVYSFILNLTKHISKN